jgi:hypothetical protein
MITAVTELLAFLAEHSDLIEDLVGVVKSGASKDSIKAALRSVKVKMSDEFVQEELGLK